MYTDQPMQNVVLGSEFIKSATIRDVNYFATIVSTYNLQH